ncbi:hypothetical protein LIER_06348 [Lithospermum erythrorhizon]|uniref:Reverse transcriptase Ty1/copia-type domain-containing protein n=1 Tax=Lithospermum erythrorhizon TaxID=34254 RepID=A0AAV3P5I1_LITER
MKDLGVLKYFLGIEVARSNVGISLCQKKYTLDIINECGLLGSRPAAFLMEPNHKLGSSVNARLAEGEKCRRLVGNQRGSLEYNTRVVRYLKNSHGQGILLRADSDLLLSGWCDSNWASCLVTRRSATG